jgi:hypothetical protein
MSVRITSVALVMALSACAPRPLGTGGTSGLTAIELDRVSASPDEPVYQTLQRVRPHWLVPGTGRPGAVVFIDGIQVGGLTTLQTIATGRVDTIAFLPPDGATRRYGSGFEGGIIELTLRR